MDMEKYQAIGEQVKAMPEVTKEEAFACFLRMASEHDIGCPEFGLICAEIVGFACAVDDPEMTRRFVVWQSQNGPVGA